LKLFVGYSGWSPGQLEKELEEGSWMIADLNPQILFETEPENIWKAAIRLLGKEYSYLANMPLNPQLN
jgi:putative transcriptional regulator